MPFRPPKRKMDLPAQQGSSSLKKSPSPVAGVRPLPAGAIQTVRAESFSGPLPPPDLLDAYERTSPGLADRIVKMAENEQTTRHGCLRRENWVASWLQIAGQLASLILAAFGIYAGYDLLSHDKSVAGFTFFIGAVATLVGTAMYRHKHTQPPHNPEQPPQARPK